MGCCVSSADTRREGHNNFSSADSNANQRQHSRQNGGSVRANHTSADNAGNNRQQSHASNTGSMRISYLQNPQVEKILNGRTAGEGIKKTPAYETPLTKNELEKWRLEFWETRTSGSPHIWQLLRNACDEDATTAEALIQASGLNVPQNSLTTGIDENGVYYRVPIACINNPTNYNQNDQYQQLKNKRAPPEKMLNALQIRSVKGDSTLSVSNLLSIKDLKQKYLEVLKPTEVKATELRFFCLGKELKDDLYIYTYDIKDETTVQAMIKSTAQQ